MQGKQYNFEIKYGKRNVEEMNDKNKNYEDTNKALRRTYTAIAKNNSHEST